MLAWCWPPTSETLDINEWPLVKLSPHLSYTPARCTFSEFFHGFSLWKILSTLWLRLREDVLNINSWFYKMKPSPPQADGVLPKLRNKMVEINGNITRMVCFNYLVKFPPGESNRYSWFYPFRVSACLAHTPKSLDIAIWGRVQLRPPKNLYKFPVFTFSLVEFW